MKGGARKKNRNLSSQQALLDSIWKVQGGVSKVARKLHKHVQFPINWRNRGGVPLINCYEVSLKLEVDIWGLNYNALTKFNAGENVPSWNTVVKSYNLSPDTVKYILSLEHP